MNRFETRVVPHDHERAVSIRAAADDSGTFEGYACIWNIVDSYGTHFERGCFDAGGLDERAYPLLWMHDPFEPGGTFTAKEDDTGLFVQGGYDSSALGNDMRVRAKSGSAPELSVGFVWRDSAEDDENAITVAKLVETSQITLRMASVPGAQISAVRSQLAQLYDDGEELDHPDAGERALRVAAARAKLLAAL
jgi:HK97 family phage prohead protease